MQITEGTLVTFSTDVAGQHTAKVMETLPGVAKDGSDVAYVLHDKEGTEFTIQADDILFVGKPKSARDWRKEAQAALRGKPGMTKAQQRAAVDQAILALQEAYQILDTEATEEAALAPKVQGAITEDDKIGNAHAEDPGTEEPGF